MSYILHFTLQVGSAWFFEVSLVVFATSIAFCAILVLRLVGISP